MSLMRENRMLAKRRWWDQLSTCDFDSLNSLTDQFGLSVALGDLLLLQGKWYVTNAGLLGLAHRSHCHGISTKHVGEFCDASIGRWIFKATVFKTPRSRGFVGFGDADPSNVSSLVHGAEMRVAETRAVNRALRKAYGVGLCSIEELGCLSSIPQPETQEKSGLPKSNGNGSSNGQPRLRDRLCLLIREHQLDASLVKRYATDFCGTDELRSASRTLVESYIAHLSEWAIRDHAGLVAKLENYSAPGQVHS